MSVSKYKILVSQTVTDNEISIPVEINWDLYDRGDSLVEFEKNAISQILNQEKDFELSRFSHEKNPNNEETDINYTFNFVPTGATIDNANWYPSYEVEGFFSREIYYFSRPFVKSFFKLDFYDTTNQKTQINHFTMILPVQQGKKQLARVGYNFQNISTPSFKLDCFGANKEGYYIYWLKNKNFFKLETFYMTAKFFDAKKGVFVKMMNRPQSIFTGVNRFNFDQERYYYYKVDLNYNKYTYQVYDVITKQRVGFSDSPINWYEYINPV